MRAFGGKQIPWTREEADDITLNQEDVRHAAGKPPLKAFRIHKMDHSCNVRGTNLRVVRKFCLFLSLICLAHYAQAGTVWIDTDVSIGSPIREVDDAFALVLAFHSPEIRIAGLSTTYGNAPLSQTTRAARDLVERFGQPAGLTVDAVFAGAGSASDLGRRSAASDALAA